MPIAPLRTLPVVRSPLILPDEIGGDGCFVLMPMNEGVGDPRDYSGNNNHGTRFGGTIWVPGRYGNAILFDGINGHVRVPHADCMDVRNALTLRAWIRPSETLNAAHATVLWLTREYRPYAFEYGSGRLEFWVEVGGAIFRARYLVDLLAGRDYRTIGTFDGQYARIYLNGRPVGIVDCGPGSLIDIRGTPLCIGSGTPVNLPFPGMVDGVELDPITLSDDEIEADYVGGRLLKQRTLAVVR